jgi:hypothetical protein
VTVWCEMIDDSELYERTRVYHTHIYVPGRYTRKTRGTPIKQGRPIERIRYHVCRKKRIPISQSAVIYHPSCHTCGSMTPFLSPSSSRISKLSKSHQSKFSEELGSENYSAVVAQLIIHTIWKSCVYMEMHRSWIVKKHSNIPFRTIVEYAPGVQDVPKNTVSS